jgi:hypothetical protein
MTKRVKYELARAHSSMVEQFPFKEAVEGSNPSGLTLAPSSSGLGHEVFSLVTWVRVPVGSHLSLCEDFFFLDSVKAYPFLYYL